MPIKQHWAIVVLLQRQDNLGRDTVGLHHSIWQSNRRPVGNCDRFLMAGRDASFIWYRPGCMTNVIRSVDSIESNWWSWFCPQTFLRFAISKECYHDTHCRSCPRAVSGDLWNLSFRDNDEEKDRWLKNPSNYDPLQLTLRLRVTHLLLHYHCPSTSRPEGKTCGSFWVPSFKSKKGMPFFFIPIQFLAMRIKFISVTLLWYSDWHDLEGVGRLWELMARCRATNFWEVLKWKKNVVFISVMIAMIW